MEYAHIQKRTCTEIEKMREEIVEALQDLVRIPSITGNEGEAQKFIEEKYRAIGLNVIRLEADLRKVNDHPAFIETGVSYEGRPNIIGRLPGDPRNHSLILNGHVDVVTPEPLDAWTHGPWAAEIEGDRMFGRGTGDMKAGLLANYFALKGILRAGFKPARLRLEGERRFLQLEC